MGRARKREEKGAGALESRGKRLREAMKACARAREGARTGACKAFPSPQPRCASVMLYTWSAAVKKAKAYQADPPHSRHDAGAAWHTSVTTGVGWPTKRHCHPSLVLHPYT